jgi:two-component system response regulator (stage 0 sporulation protein F)
VNEGLRVLVVDDDWQMAKTLADVLNLQGFGAEAACSGNGALEMLEEDRFDCVITDVKMPDVNGVELLRGVRSVHPDLPVALMTAYAPGDLVHDGLREGAIASFVKPLDLNLLVWFLTELAGQSAIVIVDDDSQCWKTVRESLENRGFTVLKVSDPVRLMQVLKPSGQVVFLGPRANGATRLEILRRIRERHKSLPVVLTIDGRGQTSSEMEKARGLNVQGCLCKPFKAEELLEVVANIRRSDLAALLRGCPGMLVSQMP